MSYEVQIRRAAELDVAEAQLWYETQRRGLGGEFHSEVSQVITVLLKLHSFIKLHIKIFAEQLSVGFLISFGIEFLTKLSLLSPASRAEEIPTRQWLVFNRDPSYARGCSSSFTYEIKGRYILATAALTLVMLLIGSTLRGRTQVLHFHQARPSAEDSALKQAKLRSFSVYQSRIFRRRKD